jgi:hypothetical protein
MNEPTVPFGEPELWRVSAFRRAMDDGQSESSRFNALSPSLMADLQRFEQPGTGAEVLEVLAACLRHAHDMAVHLDRDGHVLPIIVFPRERLFHTPLSLSTLYATRFDSVQLLQVERAPLRAPGSNGDKIAPASQCHPLGPLLWHMALYGPRRDLLPELAGSAVFRVAPDLDVPSELTGALAASVGRLRSEKVSLRTLGHWPGMSRERASRLLNGLYLQAGLIVSRAHPAATRESWFTGLGRR